LAADILLINVCCVKSQP